MVMMKKIALDASILSGKINGIGCYVSELCQHLEQFIPDATFYLYAQKDINFELPSSRWVLKLETHSFYRKLPRNLWLLYRCAQLVNKDKVDVFWCSSTLCPQYLSSHIKTITTVYDLNLKLVPETMPIITYLSYKLFFKKSVEQTNKIVTISKGTAERLESMYDCKVDGIALPSVSERYVAGDINDVNACLKRYGIERPYMLTVSSNEPRKNLKMIIRAFIELKNNNQLKQSTLIMVGGKGWKNKELPDLLNEAKPGWIKQLGYVDEADLPAIYSGASVFSFLSLYEGFGMPVLEARACGTQVIAHDIPELHEAGSDAVNYVSLDMTEIKNKIITCFANESKFTPVKKNWSSWGMAAKVLADVIKSLDVKA